MDVRMYDNGYVRLTALRRDAMPFSPTLRFALPPPLEGGEGGCSSALGNRVPRITINH